MATALIKKATQLCALQKDITTLQSGWLSQFGTLTSQQSNSLLVLYSDRFIAVLLMHLFLMLGFSQGFSFS